MVKEKTHIYENVCRTKQFLPEGFFIKSVLTWRAEASGRGRGLPGLMLTLFLGTKVQLSTKQRYGIKTQEHAEEKKTFFVFGKYMPHVGFFFFFNFKLYFSKIKFKALPSKLSLFDLRTNKGRRFKLLTGKRAKKKRICVVTSAGDVTTR